jgi:hypothetical protein
LLEVSKGIPISSLHTKAETELPLRVTRLGVIVQGMLRLASAWANNAEKILAEVEQTD